MEIFKTKREIINKIEKLKSEGKTIGFVPTMGALHQGHLSLIKCSKDHTDISVVSIFVNPTQFDNPNDLEKYPRTVDADIKKLEEANTDILFLPSEKEMYPEADNRIFDFGYLDKVMEGKYRKGHFNGVAQIVSKLFDVVKPDKSFFGLKDFQQYVIVRELVKKYLSDSNIQIIGCPIIREANGLAMSSRNELLTKKQRENASIIYKSLLESTKNKDNFTKNEIIKKVIEKINQVEDMSVEYFEIVDVETLLPIRNWSDSENIIGCIAVFCGNVRLIDNIIYK